MQAKQNFTRSSYLQRSFRFIFSAKRNARQLLTNDSVGKERKREKENEKRAHKLIYNIFDSFRFGSHVVNDKII